MLLVVVVVVVVVVVMHVMGELSGRGGGSSGADGRSGGGGVGVVNKRWRTRTDGAKIYLLGISRIDLLHIVQLSAHHHLHSAGVLRCFLPSFLPDFLLSIIILIIITPLKAAAAWYYYYYLVCIDCRVSARQRERCLLHTRTRTHAHKSVVVEGIASHTAHLAPH